MASYRLVALLRWAQVVGNLSQGYKEITKGTLIYTPLLQQNSKFDNLKKEIKSKSMILKK